MPKFAALARLVGSALLLVGCARAALPVAAPTASPTSRSPASEEWYLTTSDGVQHYVYEFGRGDTVVVIHGGYGAEHGYLVPALRPLASSHHFVLYDQRGSLRSPAADGLISLEAFVADLEALRRELGVARMTLFAHSMGAAIAYAYLQRHPDHVRGIVLSGPVLPDEFRPDTARRGRSERAFVAFAQRNDSAEAARQGLDRPGLTGRDWTRRWRISFASGNIFHIDRWADVQGGQAFYNGRIARLVYQQSPRELLDGGLTSLRRNAVPIDIVLGDHDLADFGAVYWPEIAPTLPNARVTLLREAGHNAWIDQPVEYTAALRRAFAHVRATPVRVSAGSSNVAAPAPTSRAH